MKDNRKVVITHLPIEKDSEEVFSIAKRSRLLINSICQYSKDLMARGVKIFERHANIIRTEAGYFCAFYEEDLEKNRTVKKEEIQEQFEGLDGRMKVVLHNSSGEEVVRDVAEMVAMAFVPNPDNYEFVKHKDEDLKNNKAENLYWSQVK
jgi:hypothetical protein